MSEPKQGPTPGPWEWIQDGLNGHKALVGPEETVLDVQEVAGEQLIAIWQADARLIAAAPDLLEACKELLGIPHYADDPRAVQARAAIAKAEGRP